MATETTLHEMAPHHLPAWIPAPDGSDPLFSVVIWFVVLLVLGIGVLYFKLHALPEHIAHSSNSSQLQLISILTLLALLTHNNIFWVAALVLATIRIPDFLSPLEDMAKSLRNIEKGQE